MNTTNIHALADFLDTLPDERFNMYNWFTDEYGDEDLSVSPKRLIHNCGTAACIGGWTEALFNPTAETFFGTRGLYWPEDKLPKQSAGNLLGLTVPQAKELFVPEDTPWSKITPQVAAATLRNLAETGSVTWQL